MKWMKVASFSVLVVAILCAFAYLFILSVKVMTREGNSHELWKNTYLTKSEWEYTKNKLINIVTAWQELGRESTEYNPNHERVLRATPFLIIDLEAHSLRIEQNGEIYNHHKIELSDKLQWSLGITNPDGNRPLESPVVAQYVFTSKPEQINIHAIGPKNHFNIHFSNSGRGTTSGGGKGGPGTTRYTDVPPDWQDMNSILFSEGSLDEYKTLVNHLQVTSQTQEKPQESFSEEKKEWQEIEPQLYREIEWQMLQDGYELTQIRVTPGPDYHTAHASVHGYKRSVLFAFLGGSRYVGVDLVFEHLEHGIWYAISGADPRFQNRPVPGNQINMEFLITHDPNQLEEEEPWLKQGRKKLSTPDEISTPWSYTLPNKVRIEFIGVCEHPSAGKEWWGPEGQPINDVPFINRKDHFAHITEGRIARVFAYRILFSGNGGQSGGKTLVEGNSGSASFSIRDKYGRQLHSIRGNAYLFDENRETTNMTIYYSYNNSPRYGCTLKNISLIKGKKTEFEIIAAGIDEEENR